MELLLPSLMELNVAKLYNPTFLSLLILFFSFVIWVKRAKRPKLNLPPSPPKLPIIGNIHQWGRLPHRSLRGLSKKYGSLFLMQLGHNTTLVVSSAEMAREIVKNHDIVFSSRPSTTAAKTLLYGCRDVGFAPYGEYWRQARKICVLELLSLRRVHSFQFIRDEEVEALINKIGRASDKGESIILSEMVMAVSNNIVSRCVLSQKTDEQGDGSNNNFGQLSRRIMVFMTSFCVGDMFPYLKWMDVLTGLIPSMKAVSREVDLLLDPIIEEHRALKSHEGCGKDFISIILQLQRDGLCEMELTQDNIKGILLDMFVGAVDSTATTTEWLMSELIKHPNVMKKVQEEVRNVAGNKSKIDVGDIQKMGYLKSVIKETLRLHPPAPMLAPRETTKSVKLGGYDIPSNITVFINAFAIHRDPKWWDKPEEFIPERFECSHVDYKGQDFQYIPFGFGRRGCPGMEFGVASVEYVVANLLYWFDWKLPADEIAEKLDMSELYGLVVYKKVPLNVVPIFRSSI